MHVPDAASPATALLTHRHFHNLAKEIGVDNRRKPPSVGAEAEARKQAAAE